MPTHKVRFVPVHIDFDVNEDETVLNAAFRQGVSLTHGCREGQCGACKSFLIETFKTTIEAIEPLTHDIRHLVLKLTEPERRLRFNAGQYMSLRLPDSDEYRAYSMANTPRVTDRLEFIIKVFPGGRFSGLLDGGFTIGQEVEVKGPYGVFMLREKYDTDIVCVGGGSGMAPLWSLLADTYGCKVYCQSWRSTHMRGNSSMASLDATTTEITPDQIYLAIADVLDPELDESLVKLGFIDRVTVDGPDVAITFKLPTYWCSPNFAYLMAADLRQRAATVPGVRDVRVALLDHCAEDEVSNAVNQGQSFADAFPEETSEDAHLENLRRIFLRKGFLMRQDTLLRQMLKIGLDETIIAALRVHDMRYDEGSNNAWVRVDGVEHRLERVGRSALAYQQRRVTLGLPHSGDDPLIIDDQGQPLRAGELREFLRRSRSIRMNIMFNTALCKGLFQTRYGGESNSPQDHEDEDV